MRRHQADGRWRCCRRLCCGRRGPATGESRADFAARAGVGLHVVEGAEDGTRPAWDLPYAEFMALADAVAVLNPSLRDAVRDRRGVRSAADLPDARRPGDGHRRAGRRRHAGHGRGAAAVGDHRGVPAPRCAGARCRAVGLARGVRRVALPGVRLVPVPDRPAGAGTPASCWRRAAGAAAAAGGGAGPVGLTGRVGRRGDPGHLRGCR